MGFFNDIYKDPLTIRWFDEIAQTSEEQKVMNGKVVLSYIPDQFQKVAISGYVEIPIGAPTGTNQYVVNYTNGIVSFHQNVADNTNLNISYFARGIIQYGSDRLLLQDELDLLESDNVEDAFKETIGKANSIQAQVNQLVIEGDSSVEAAQARVDKNGVAFTTLKERIDSDQSKIEVLSKSPNEHEWTATEGQLVYSLPINTTYDPNSKWLEVTVGGAPVTPSLIQKDNANQFTLKVAASYIPAGVKVVARWVEPFIPATSGHKNVHEAGGYDEIDVTKLKNYNVINAQLAENAKKTDGIVSVMEHGAIGDGVTDDTQAFKDALATLTNKGTLFIPPDGQFLITGLVTIHCNVDCKGEILVPSSATGTIFHIPRENEVTYKANQLFNTLNKDSLKMDMSATPVIAKEELVHYYFHISSSEHLFDRLGSDKYTPYTKNETGEFKTITSKGLFTKTRVLHTYTNLATVDVILSKKSETIFINGLKVKRIPDTVENFNQTILLVNRNSVVFNDFSYENDTTSYISEIIRLDKCANITLNKPYIKNASGSGDTYAILNMYSAYIDINGYRYEDDHIGTDKGYAARHGNYVTFRDCETYGVDDHWGHNYLIENCKFVKSGITYAGENIKIKDTDFFDCFQAFTVRGDTPFVEGKLLFDNCTFYNTARPFYFRIITNDPLGRTPVAELKCFDVMEIRNCKTIDSFENSEEPFVDGITATNYANRRFIRAGVEGSDYTGKVKVGLIKVTDCDFDIQVCSILKEVPFEINRIQFKNIEVNPYKSLGFTIYGGLLRLIGVHTVNEVEMINCRNGSIAVDDATYMPTIGEAIHTNCRFDATNIYVKTNSTVTTKVTFEDCVIKEKDNFRLYNSHIFLKNNRFEANIGTVFHLGVIGTLVQSTGNIAGANITPSYLPPLDNYINETYYKQAEMYGSNANGDWFKYPDGTMICRLLRNSTLTPTTADGSVFKSSSESWTFPVPFANGTNLTVSIDTVFTNRWATIAGTPTKDSVSYCFLSTVSNASTGNVVLTAIGRWK